MITVTISALFLPRRTPPNGFYSAIGRRYYTYTQPMETINALIAECIQCGAISIEIVSIEIKPTQNIHIPDICKP